MLALGPSKIYLYSVAEYLKRDVRDERVRVRGLLVKGTLCEIEPGCGYRFKIGNDPWSSSPDPAPPGKHAELSVHYDRCVTPDTLRDIPGWDVFVTVEGQRCQTCHAFEADEVMARGPYKYGPDGGRLHVKPLPRCRDVTPRM